MKTTGRKKSTNIVDKRSYFGTESMNGIQWKNKVAKFVNDSFQQAGSNQKPTTRFEKK